MRKALCLTLLLVSTAWADKTWTYASMDRKGNNWYLDPASVSRTAASVKCCVKITYSDAAMEAERAQGIANVTAWSETYSEYSPDHKYTTLRMVLHGKDGKVTADGSVPAAWQPITPGTMRDTVWKMLYSK